MRGDKEDDNLQGTQGQDSLNSDDGNFLIDEVVAGMTLLEVVLVLMISVRMEQAIF